MCTFKQSKNRTEKKKKERSRTTTPPPLPQSPLNPSRLPVTDPDGLSLLNSPPIFPSAGSDWDIQGQVNSG